MLVAFFITAGRYLFENKNLKYLSHTSSLIFFTANLVLSNILSVFYKFNPIKE